MINNLIVFTNSIPNQILFIKMRANGGWKQNVVDINNILRSNRKHKTEILK